MARIRTIKPEFFTSEDIVALPALARLLYIALWCEADREGRFAWKPRTFKMRYFPADDCDIDALARVLVASRLVVLYGDGLAYIPSFAKHQHVNPREAASNLPNPDASLTREHASLTVTDAQVGREGKEGKGKEGEEIGGSTAVDPLPNRSDPIPYEAIRDAYNTRMTKLPKVRELTTKRRTAIRRAWMETPERRDVEFWRAYFDECAADPFRNGTGPYRNGHENWRPDFDFLIRPDQVTRVFEAAMSRLDDAP